MVAQLLIEVEGEMSDLSIKLLIGAEGGASTVAQLAAL
jgi:2-polyprenyl-6-methoxyphenol hydroxylase-like FAD-dependent oxidoreductase